MVIQFTKATKEQAKLRLAIFGPSGSGKTYSALRVATGLGKKIALADTEHGSASKYADRFDFDTVSLPHNTIETYIAALEAAGQAGYDVLIIDSLSHGWYELLEEVQLVAKTKYRGNTWAAWSEGTPKQKALINAILSYPGHIIATMRTKTEWLVTQDEKGQTTPRRVGLAPEAGKGIEYEFDLLFEVDPDHIATVLKDRTGKYQDQIIKMPSEELGQELAEWLLDGEPLATEAQKINICEKLKQLGAKDVDSQLVAKGYPVLEHIKETEATELLKRLNDALNPIEKLEEETEEETEAPF